MGLRCAYGERVAVVSCMAFCLFEDEVLARRWGHSAVVAAQAQSQVDTWGKSGLSSAQKSVLWRGIITSSTWEGIPLIVHSPGNLSAFTPCHKRALQSTKPLPTSLPVSSDSGKGNVVNKEKSSFESNCVSPIRSTFLSSVLFFASRSAPS